MRPWFNNNQEQQKSDRRAGAKEFLQKTITDPDLRKDIITYPEKAREYFRIHGDIDVPDDVKVICVEPDTQSRDRVVVFVLPETTVDPDNLDPMKYWIAGWIPY